MEDYDLVMEKKVSSEQIALTAFNKYVGVWNGVQVSIQQWKLFLLNSFTWI